MYLTRIWHILIWLFSIWCWDATSIICYHLYIHCVCCYSCKPCLNHGMLWHSRDWQGFQIGWIRQFVEIYYSHCAISPFVSRWAGTSHSSTFTGSLFCSNHHCCPCSRIQHPGVWFFTQSVMPSSNNPSNSWYSPSYMANTLSLSWLAKRWCNAVVRYIIPGLLTTFQESTCTSSLWNFHQWQSIWHLQGCQSTFAAVHFQVSHHGKSKPRSYTFLGMTTTSDFLTGLKYWKYQTPRLAIQLFFTDIM